MELLAFRKTEEGTEQSSRKEHTSGDAMQVFTTVIIHIRVVPFTRMKFLSCKKSRHIIPIS